MADLLDKNAKIDLTCPECNRTFGATLAEIRKSKVDCPGCGVHFEASSFDKALRDAEKRLRNFGR